MEEQQGSVYIEALVAVAILVVAILPAYSSFVLAPKVQSQASQNLTAMNIARSTLEYYQSISGSQWDCTPPSPPALCTPPSPPAPDQTGYTVSVTAAQPDMSLPLKTFTVTVNWTDSHGQPNNLVLATSIARRPW